MIKKFNETILTLFNNRKREEEEVKQVKKFKSFLENVFMSNSVQMK
jgi:hypothetical protein